MLVQINIHECRLWNIASYLFSRDEGLSSRLFLSGSCRTGLAVEATAAKLDTGKRPVAARRQNGENRFHMTTDLQKEEDCSRVFIMDFAYNHAVRILGPHSLTSAILQSTEEHDSICRL